MQVRVTLFARFKELACADHVYVDLPDPATVGDLRQQLCEIYPSASGLLQRSAIAVDHDFARDNVLLSSQMEIALLPPVSGGK
jgi:molybdopterin converting factor subunit 1